ncbi:MAG: hypothetical protein KDC35_11265 [Acidobacteria bacterium]|nr:hypothetical protein [Acidobacteriota bacterium]
MKCFVLLCCAPLLAQTIEIPDVFLKSCLVADYDQNGDSQISMAEAQAATAIRCSGRDIQDLTGVEAFTNITILDVDQNRISALPDLSALSLLEELEIGENQIEVLPDLSSFSHLRVLYVIANGMRQMGPLPPQLEALYAGGNILTQLPDLPQNLQVLSVAWNNLNPAPDLSQVNQLRSLQIGHNAFTTLPDISHLSQLSFLELEGLNLSEIPDLSGFPNLEGLAIGDNPLTSIPDLSPYRLQYLSLTGLGLTDLPDLNNQLELSTLYAQRNQFIDVQQLADLPSLSFVNLNENQLRDFPDVAGWQDMCCLFVRDNQLTDLPNGLDQLDRISLFFIQNNLLDLNDCADILALNQKEGLTFAYTPQLTGELDCQSLGAAQAVIPWIVNNSQWTSRVSLFNATQDAVSVQLVATTRSGDRGEKVIEMAPNSVFVSSSDDLFGALTGYALTIHSPSDQIYPSFITFNRDAASKASPAQTVGQFADQWHERLLFAYLPGDMIPAIVLVAPMASGATEISCQLFDGMGPSGEPVALTLTDNRPLALLVKDIFQLEQLPIGAAVQVSSDQRLAGTSFVFNSFLEPSMTIPFPLP